MPLHNKTEYEPFRSTRPTKAAEKKPLPFAVGHISQRQGIQLLLNHTQLPLLDPKAEHGITYEMKAALLRPLSDKETVNLTLFKKDLWYRLVHYRELLVRMEAVLDEVDAFFYDEEWDTLIDMAFPLNNDEDNFGEQGILKELNYDQFVLLFRDLPSIGHYLHAMEAIDSKLKQLKKPTQKAKYEALKQHVFEALAVFMRRLALIRRTSVNKIETESANAEIEQKAKDMMLSPYQVFKERITGDNPHLSPQDLLLLSNTLSNFLQEPSLVACIPSIVGTLESEFVLQQIKFLSRADGSVSSGESSFDDIAYDYLDLVDNVGWSNKRDSEDNSDT